MDSQKLFLSYSTTEAEQVEAVRSLLAARGVATFLDRRDLPAGEPWPQALEAALSEASAVAVFVGRDGLGKWQKREMDFALVLQAHREERREQLPVIPVILPGGDPARGFLFLNTWIDLRRALDDPEALGSLERAAKGQRVDVVSEGEESSVCPYRGLQAFEEEDASLFFGREELSERLLDKVLRERFVAVVGPSGCGKSSVVKAGLVPRLRRRRPPDPTWDILSFRPGERPFHGLAGALLPDLEPGLSETDLLLEIGKLGRGLESGEIRLQDVLDRILQKSSGTDRLLILVDQFEELFTLTQTEQMRRKVVETLFSGTRKVPAHLVLTLRADYYGNALSLDRDLSDRIEAGLVNVGPLRTEELRRVVEQPARLAGLELEVGLTSRIVDELESEPGNLPLMEYALTELWKLRRSDRLTHGAYEEIGEVGGAIAQRAEGELARLSTEETEATRRLFARLVRAASPAEGAEDTRRRAVVSELGASERAAIELLAGANARLLVTGRDETTGEETVEVAHEALIRNWPRLRGWLDEDREFLLWRQRLRVKRSDWERSGHDSEGLLRGGFLAEAERWFRERTDELSGEEERYIHASLELRAVTRQQTESKRRRRTLSWAIASLVLLIVASVMGLLYVHSEQQAHELLTRSLVESAASSSDPVVGVLLLQELGQNLGGTDPPGRAIELARRLMATPIPLAILRGQGGALVEARFSPDSSRVVAYSDDGIVWGWAADGRGDPVVLMRPGGEILSAALGEDGLRVGSASEDGTVRVWSPKGTGEPVVLQGHSSVVFAAEFSRDGSQVVTASSDGTARVWRADGAGEPVVLKGHTGAVFSAEFSRDGSQVVTASSDGTARVWRADGVGAPVVLRGQLNAVSGSDDSRRSSDAMTVAGEGREPMDQPEGTSELAGFTLVGDSVLSAKFSGDGSRVVTLSFDGTVRVWKADGTGDPVVLGESGDLVSSAEFSEDGLKVVTASSDGTARVWPADGVGNPMVLRGHGGTVESATFSRDGSRVVTVSSDGTARVWQLTSTGEPVVLRDDDDVTLSAEVGDSIWWAFLTDVPWNAEFSEDGMKVVTSSPDGPIQVWRTDGTEVPVVLEGSSGLALSASFSRDGSKVVSVCSDGMVRVWASDGTGRPMVLRGDMGANLDAAFGEESSKVVTASRNGDVRVWQVEGTGEPVVLGRQTGQVRDVSFSRDGSRVATASLDGTARVWRVDGVGDPVVLRGHDDMVWSVKFSWDGSRVVTSSYDGTARVWQADGTGSPVVLQGHGGAILSASFSPNGSRVVTTSSDGTVQMWWADGTGQPVVLGRTSMGVSTAFNGDGSRVVTVSVDGGVQVWTVGWEALLDRLGTLTTACLTVEQRRALLAETAAVARTRYEDCERGYGRDPGR